MREITDHQTNECNKSIKIEADEYDHNYGNASHSYHILVNGVPTNHIKFQRGPIKEVGVNGITNEALLAILIDRLRGFQSGPFKCEENALALAHCEEALRWLKNRTASRVKRGVEGTNTP